MFKVPITPLVIVTQPPTPQYLHASSSTPRPSHPQADNAVKTSQAIADFGLVSVAPTNPVPVSWIFLSLIDVSKSHPSLYFLAVASLIERQY
jgi:hypothetical protein